MFPTMELYMRSVIVVARNIYHTVMLYELAKLLGLEFYWFSFSKNQFGKDKFGNLNYDVENTNYTKLLDSLQNEYKDFI